eukprot:CAMPEP_0175702356 /NCGR_PEP_ID=MMETSP0097-20121207/35964_1 /TAXON_ID=311494 /ORGANISM="Alexandrium monilatum, Strain CCMP3105" /LENGTH=138 /DNA_ID=CAMNT_0017009621 /DNA_START=12 /DNA_END=428 /DNA_ORIENTATION=+
MHHLFLVGPAVLGDPIRPMALRVLLALLVRACSAHSGHTTSVPSCTNYTAPAGKTCRHSTVATATHCSQCCNDVEGLNSHDWNGRKCDCKDGSSTRDLCTNVVAASRACASPPLLSTVLVLTGLALAGAARPAPVSAA